ncbi:MbtH family NRPS accessory protein [Streptomyces sp. NPDC059618]
MVKELNMNPCDNPEGEFLVLVDDESRHAPWPDFVDALGG